MPIREREVTTQAASPSNQGRSEKAWGGVNFGEDFPLIFGILLNIIRLL